MMPDRRLVKISKFLSLILRHKPDTIGIALDGGGWADIADLIEAAKATGLELDRASLYYVVEHNDKKRFALSEDGCKIRANQGHSISIDLGLMPQAPPEILYHGTAVRFLASIVERGLVRRRRSYVHLSGDIETAFEVGKRHGRAVILAVKAGEMYRREYKFYQSANGVWLTEYVPPESIFCLET